MTRTGRIGLAIVTACMVVVGGYFILRAPVAGVGPLPVSVTTPTVPPMATTVLVMPTDLSTAPQPNALPSSSPPTITYAIGGSGTAMVTYIVGPGLSEEQHNVTLPWSVTLTADQLPQTPIIGAMHQTGVGTISCTVTGSDGSTIIAHATSSGAYANVQCTPSL